MNRTHRLLAITAGAAATVLVGCATLPSPAELDTQTTAMHKADFRAQGIAGVDRLDQDLGQRACSSDQPPAPAIAKQIETESLAAVKWPSDGKYIGNWRDGERLAQNGRGMTWSDAKAEPTANGGMCYNCHQIGPAEISFGNIGPSLHQYGKIRGVKDPAAPASAEIVKYTWGKLWNSKAYSACSNMPRFGHAKLLDEDQIRHLMALLLDPKSPVNQ
ncbi:sulfur oxidation c-type cytochrome SoxX [Aquincola sp. S2]|uniref:Sulfur oxidation c-type cytochrome SoxX n=1 Tax=Pseudaquabacterium terrae TaxID=2732868 RepID=A0ABX2EV88_9BURK|nr:sulfur oxidation c-type cytochrome SoxX [Aquabacterium terrae]NRF72339.1 sulfur oxidation c-type cytochrome SoxX [Aquabacterium terrae]